MLAKRGRIHYNTIRPHSSLGYRSPAPETIARELGGFIWAIGREMRMPMTA